MSGHDKAVEAAMRRIKNATKSIAERSKKAIRLQDAAAIMVEAAIVHSAAAMLYDELYRASESLGVLGVEPECPLPGDLKQPKRAGGG